MGSGLGAAGVVHTLTAMPTMLWPDFSVMTSILTAVTSPIAPHGRTAPEARNRHPRGGPWTDDVRRYDPRALVVRRWHAERSPPGMVAHRLAALAGGPGWRGGLWRRWRRTVDHARLGGEPTRRQ